MEFKEGEAIRIKSTKNDFLFDTFIPVFMIKDGKKYFIRHKRPHNLECIKIEQIIVELKQNGGSHYTDCGVFTNPLELIQYVKKNNLNLLSEKKRNSEKTAFFDFRNNQGYGAGFTEFIGRIEETGSRFNYRIYSDELYGKLRMEVKKLKKERFWKFLKRSKK